MEQEELVEELIAALPALAIRSVRRPISSLPSIYWRGQRGRWRRGLGGQWRRKLRKVARRGKKTAVLE